MGVVPAFDELEDCQLCLGMRTESISNDEFVFQRGEEALTHRVIVAMSALPLGQRATRFRRRDPEDLLDPGVINGNPQLF